MKPDLRCVFRMGVVLLIALLLPALVAAEPLTLKRVVELALSHSTMAVSAAADSQRAFASYREARNQYLPQIVAGSGLGYSHGFPLTLEGSAPSLINVNSQSALFNPSLHDFVRAAKTDYEAAKLQSKDQRNQVIQDTVLSYAELHKWEDLSKHLQQEQVDAGKSEEIVNQRIQEGVDNPQMRNKARLATARVRLRAAEAQGAIDVLRKRLSELTGLPPAWIVTAAESIPPLPEIKQEEDLAAKAAQNSPAVQSADTRAAAQDLRARGEHRAIWPTVDFAAQYALLSNFNNYADFYRRFERNNASIGLAIRFPFLNWSQHARAEAADAEAVHAHKQAENAKNQVSEETLRLQRSVQQLAAAQEVADLEYQVAQSNLETLRVKLDSGGANLHDVDDARAQVNQLYNALQDANFELERARITLLRATDELAAWVGVQ
ncbi:MAG: TolC family protein [Acidobacteriia bacterium]|nr:TolC family protein [Terriglobia bacterium]